MSTKRIILIICSFFLFKSVIAQFAIKTNVLFPLTFVNDWSFGFDVAYDAKLNPKYSLRTSIHANRMLIESSGKSGINGGVEDTLKNYLEKAGVRLMLKKYKNEEKENTLASGFFSGVFADIMYARNHNVTKNGLKVNEEIPDTGLFVGAGYSFGYTWKINKWIIEPNVGLGIAILTVGILKKPNPDEFLSGLKNVPVIVSPTHFELHIGREF